MKYICLLGNLCGISTHRAINMILQSNIYNNGLIDISQLTKYIIWDPLETLILNHTFKGKSHEIFD